MTADASSSRRVIVIGAGAAGAVAAIFSAASGADTLLVERTRDGGRKILISGGGRCNILPARLDESRFVSDAPPHLVRRIVRSWPIREQIDFFERDLGLPLVEEVESAKLFPASERARDVRDRLLEQARRNGARLLMNNGYWHDISTDEAPMSLGCGHRRRLARGRHRNDCRASRHAVAAGICGMIRFLADHVGPGPVRS